MAYVFDDGKPDNAAGGYRFVDDEGGFKASVKNTVGSAIKGAGQAAADFLPFVGPDNALKQYGQSVVDANPTAVGSLGDIADKPWTALKEAVGNALPSMGGMVGVRALGQGITALSPLTGPAAPVVAGLGQAVSWGGPAAIAALPSYGGIREKQEQNDPEGFSGARDKAIALLGAATVGAIETKFGPQNWALGAMTKEGRDALAKKFAAKTLTGSIAKGALAGSLAEGSEELAQNPIEQIAGFEDPRTRKNIEETLFGGAMGALGGGVIGGVGGGIAGNRNPQSERDKVLERTANLANSNENPNPVKPALVVAPSQGTALSDAANRLGISAQDLAAVISYETGGTMSPKIMGGTGGKYLGLIQFGPEEQKRYGAHAGQTFDEQMQAVERYLKDRGLPKGADLATIYRTINGGNPNAGLNLSDGNGTIAQHIERITKDHLPKAQVFLGQNGVQATAEERDALAALIGRTRSITPEEMVLLMENGYAKETDAGLIPLPAARRRMASLFIDSPIPAQPAPDASEKDVQLPAPIKVQEPVPNVAADLPATPKADPEVLTPMQEAFKRAQELAAARLKTDPQATQPLSSKPAISEPISAQPIETQQKTTVVEQANIPAIPETVKPESPLDKIGGKPVADIPLPKLRKFAEKGGPAVKARAQAELDRRNSAKEEDRIAREAQAKLKDTPSHDLLRMLIDMGGVNKNAALDIAGDKGVRGLGGLAARVFRAPTRNAAGRLTQGHGLDDIALFMVENGWLNRSDLDSVDGGAQAVSDMIRDAIDGTLAPVTEEQIQKAFQQDQEARAMAEEDAQAVVEAIGSDWAAMNEAEKEVELDDIFGPSGEKTDTKQAGESESAGAADGEGQTEQSLSLEGQAAEELTAEAQAQRDEETAARENKAIADRERDAFTLSQPQGSVTTKPENSPTNQRDMFASPAQKRESVRKTNALDTPVKMDVVDDETGNVVSVTMPAKEAISQVDSDIEKAKGMLKCLLS